MGRIYQQTFIDTYAKVGFAKLYDVKTAITAADLLNDQVLPFYDEHSIPLCRVLSDRGSEYCGNPERHEYELYLAIEDIDHSRTKTKSPQTNGICERFHKTMLDEFYRVAFRKKLYRMRGSHRKACWRGSCLQPRRPSTSVLGRLHCRRIGHAGSAHGLFTSASGFTTIEPTWTSGCGRA